MSKAEILADLKSRGQFDKNSKDATWLKAFDLYYKETRRKLSPSCGSCFTTLRNWLKS